MGIQLAEDKAVAEDENEAEAERKKKMQLSGNALAWDSEGQSGINQVCAKGRHQC